MIARQSVWTDPEVKKLVAKFIPAADEVGRLYVGQRCRMSALPEGRRAGATTPAARDPCVHAPWGLNATTADGTFLASLEQK